VISPNSFQISKNWWIQFPYPLRLITKIRFYAAFGAGATFNLSNTYASTPAVGSYDYAVIVIDKDFRIKN